MHEIVTLKRHDLKVSEGLCMIEPGPVTCSVITPVDILLIVGYTSRLAIERCLGPTPLSVFFLPPGKIMPLEMIDQYFVSWFPIPLNYPPGGVLWAYGDFRVFAALRSWRCLS
jgi:hypothetical protein